MKQGDSNQEQTYLKLRRLQELRRDFSLFFYKPYVKQKEFHDNGARYRERLLMAANQSGKTYSAGFESAFHATGLYPDWWQGHRRPRHNRGWVGSVTSELTRDGAQRILLGPIGHWGTGTIPKDRIVDIKRARGVPDAVETILVRHVNKEISQITFKAYSDGREAWQAETLDWVWFDEEPPIEIYSEGVTRTNNTGGPVYLTFTPLLGMSSVVLRFTGTSHPDRALTNMTIDDVEHYTEEERARIVAAYPEHEREARSKGIPMLGSGRIFPVAEEVIAERSLPHIPQHWKQIIGLDFGWEHPTAAARLAYDTNADCIHVVNCYKRKEAVPILHAGAIKPWGQWIPVAWPHDGFTHDKGNSGKELRHIYADHGLRMLSEHATFGDDRGFGVEAGIAFMLERMQTGRFKVDETLVEWFDEYRMYHRKDGEIVKERDDLMSATRYGVMMIRYALAEGNAPKPRDRYASGRYSNENGTWMSR